MEVNNKFEVLEEGDVVAIKHTILRKLNKVESLSELDGLMGEINKLEQQKNQLTSDLENNTLQKQLEQTNKQLDEILQLKNKWVLINNSIKNDLKEKIKSKVKLEKAEHGYERTEDNNKKIALQNIILTKVLSDIGLNPTTKPARELTQEFIKIFDEI